jgi:hypothetical protein
VIELRVVVVCTCANEPVVVKIVVVDFNDVKLNYMNKRSIYVIFLVMFEA